ncbi:MAG: chaperone NapD [Betaproteobacteria bacterium]|nr:chaperone NapD [Betaproteobacteria bacterium]
MNLSGILVIAKPEWVPQVVADLAAQDGLEVHQTDPESGRIIVVQEATDVHAEIEGVKRIKAMPHVVMADMVYHYFAEDEQAYDAMPAELAEDTSVCVPAYLNA